MKLPKGASYKFISTKSSPLKTLLDELSQTAFTGYIRLTVEQKGELMDGYILFNNGDVVGAESQQGDEILFSKKAFNSVKTAWELEGIADIYSFTDFQIQLSLEENEEALFKPLSEFVTTQKVKPKKEAKVHSTPPPSQSIEASTESADENKVAEGIIKKREERLAILKKFGLKEPEDEFVESILRGFNLPTEKELNNKSREIKKEILSKLKHLAKFEELDLYINPAKMHDTVEFNIDVYIKPLSKDLEEEVKTAVENTLREMINFPYEKGLKINSA